VTRKPFLLAEYVKEPASTQGAMAKLMAGAGLNLSDNRRAVTRKSDVARAGHPSLSWALGLGRKITLPQQHS